MGSHVVGDVLCESISGEDAHSPYSASYLFHDRLIGGEGFVESRIVPRKGYRVTDGGV